MVLDGTFHKTYEKSLLLSANIFVERYQVTPFSYSLNHSLNELRMRLADTTHTSRSYNGNLPQLGLFS